MSDAFDPVTRAGSHVDVTVAADHGITGAFNVVATVSLFVLLVGAVSLVARNRRVAAALTVPRWLVRIPVVLPVIVAAAGLAGVVYSYAVLY